VPDATQAHRRSVRLSALIPQQVVDLRVSIPNLAIAGDRLEPP
jgi:hypothetical protein